MENINEANTSFIKALAAANLQVSNYEVENLIFVISLEIKKIFLLFHVIIL